MDFPTFLTVAIQQQLEDEEDKNRAFDQHDVMLTHLLSEILGFSYRLVPPIDGEMGRPLANGSWTGMVGMVQRREADLIISKIAVNVERSSTITFSYPFNIVFLSFASRKFSYSPELTTFLSPFASEIWISTVLCLTIMPFVFYFLFRRRYSLKKLSLELYGSMLQQSDKVEPRGFAEYSALACWHVGVMFLSYSYLALLLSFLTFPPIKGVRTIPELSQAVLKGTHRVITYPGSFLLTTLLETYDPALRIIGLDLKKNKASKDAEAVLGNTDLPSIPVFLGDSVDFASLRGRYFISEDEFFTFHTAVGMNKKFCCKQQIDRAIFTIWAAGLHKKITDDNTFMKSLRKRMEQNDKKESDERPLSIEDFKGSFIFLITGYIVSFTVLIIEEIWHKSLEFQRYKVPMN